MLANADTVHTQPFYFLFYFEEVNMYLFFCLCFSYLCQVIISNKQNWNLIIYCFDAESN